MIFRKAVALCFLLFCLPLMSCAGKKAVTTGAITGDDLNSGNNISFESAYAKYSPSDIVLTSSGGEHHVTWDLMYYFICLAIEEVYGTTGAYPDLGDTSETGYHGQIMARAEESALACLAIEYAAAEIGAEITGDDRASIALNQELAEEQEGGSEAFEEYLSAIHASRDVYLYLTGIIDYLYENTVIATYGEGARLFSDADTASFLNGEEYFTVKQIFFSASADDGVTPLGDDERLIARDRAKSVLVTLNSYAGDDFDAFFDELMFEHSEDTTSLNMYPGGYLFKRGQAYPALEAAASSLEVGALSGVIETELGYHIVYRLPLNYDIIPQGFAWDARKTLRSQA
ncbi:MAG: hypothetical protein GX823_01245, partial [Clostridiales bacterium]|nr:hypothetical protein [Clostridiales bacterium]